MSWMLNFAWPSASEFLAMGGYGLYVWGSFGVCALVIAAEILMIQIRRRTLRMASAGDPLSGDSAT